jgi:hypothetical protein
MIRLGSRQRSGEEAGPEYYARNKSKLLKKHDSLISAGREATVVWYGESFGDTLARESVAEFEALIPHLPYIGGQHNSMTDEIVVTASALALHRVMKRHGKGIERTGELLYRTAEAWIERYPRLLRRLMGWAYLSWLGQCQSKRKAAASQERRYPGDWVREHVEGNGDAFAWGVDYVECGSVKFLHSQGADELAPYLCLLDYALFGALGVELKRTMTLAQGGEKCDFRFRRGESPSSWPPPWLDTQEE